LSENRRGDFFDSHCRWNVIDNPTAILKLTHYWTTIGLCIANIRVTFNKTSR